MQTAAAWWWTRGRSSRPTNRRCHSRRLRVKVGRKAGEEATVRAQDEAEFAQLVFAMSPRLNRLAYAVCGDRPLAEDAVQSAMVSAYRTWPRVRDVDSSEAYLRKMVVNQL